MTCLGLERLFMNVWEENIEVLSHNNLHIFNMVTHKSGKIMAADQNQESYSGRNSD